MVDRLVVMRTAAPGVVDGGLVEELAVAEAGGLQ